MASIPLTMLASTLANKEHVPVRYRSLYNAAIDGRLPTAVKQENGRWAVDDDAVPEIAELFRDRGAAAA